MRIEKIAILGEVTARVKDSDYCFIIDHGGVTVAQFAKLRKDLRALDSRLLVVKNTFLAKVAKEKGWSEEVNAMFAGNTAIVTGHGEATAVAKAIMTFVKDSNGKYTKPASPASVGDLEVYTVLNIAPTATRKVIQRKVDSAYKPLDKPVFTVYYADGQSIVRLQKQNGIVETLKDLKAQSSGVTWIGTLPYGIYYLVETTDAEGNSLERESWIRYTLTVGDDSVTAPGSRDGVVIK